MDRVFEQDELVLCVVDPSWSRKELLGQRGMFILEDIAKPLGMGPAKIKKLLFFSKEKREAALAAGIRQALGVCFVRMLLFAPYYREITGPEHREADPTWDAKRLLAEKGVFRFSAILKRLPAAQNLRHKGRYDKHARKTMGVWKQGKTWLVEMAVFAAWYKKNVAGSALIQQKRSQFKSKYAALIWNLDPEKVYSASMIYHAGVDAGLLKLPEGPNARWRLSQVVRLSLCQISVRAGFPKEGDGIVSHPGSGSAKGWLGSRWQSVMAPEKKRLSSVSEGSPTKRVSSF